MGDESIIILGKDIEVTVHEEPRRSFKVKAKITPKIDQAIKLAKLHNAPLSEFLDNLKIVIEDNIEYPKLKNLSTHYRKVLHEYSEFTRFHVNVSSCNLAPDLSKITITMNDDMGRLHTLEIVVDYNETLNIFRPTNLDLPEKLITELSKNSSSIITIYDQFLLIIEQLQPFFDVMSELDTTCSILNPENPSKKDCFRRIRIDETCSVIVTIEPFDVSARPDMKFLGPERLVEKFRIKLNQNLDTWDSSLGIVQGLLDILGLDSFKEKPQTSTEALMDTGDCSICFSARLNGELPEIICNNKSCGKFYHKHCLYEWLISVNSRRAFDEIHGQCPNCERSISCPIVEGQ